MLHLDQGRPRESGAQRGVAMVLLIEEGSSGSVEWSRADEAL